MCPGPPLRKAGGPGARRPLHTLGMAALVLLAHVGHWLWVLYLPPILIVIGSLLWSKLKERD